MMTQVIYDWIKSGGRIVVENNITYGIVIRLKYKDMRNDLRISSDELPFLNQVIEGAISNFNTEGN